MSDVRKHIEELKEYFHQMALTAESNDVRTAYFHSRDMMQSTLDELDIKEIERKRHAGRIG